MFLSQTFPFQFRILSFRDSSFSLAVADFFLRKKCSYEELFLKRKFMEILSNSRVVVVKVVASQSYSEYLWQLFKIPSTFPASLTLRWLHHFSRHVQTCSFKNKTIAHKKASAFDVDEINSVSVASFKWIELTSKSAALGWVVFTRWRHCATNSELIIQPTHKIRQRWRARWKQPIIDLHRFFVERSCCH